MRGGPRDDPAPDSDVASSPKRPAQGRRLLHVLGRWRWRLLLGLLLTGFVLQPLAPASPVAEVAGVALTLLVLGGAIFAGKPGRRLAAAAAAIMAAALILEVLRFQGVGGLAGPLAGLTFVIVLGALAATFAELIDGRHSTADTLVGAIFGYFLMAAVWALLFRQLEIWRPGSFNLAPGPQVGQFLYFSLITMTTVGYGDVLPAAPVARIWAALEAAAGTLYIAILIGRIVGELHRPRRED